MKYIISCSGTAYTITRIADGATLFLQGDDALSFGRQLEATHEGYTDDDVCAEYDSVFVTGDEG